MSTTEADLRLALASIAATCARMCARLIAAEKIIAEIRDKPRCPVDVSDKVRKMIADYDKDKAS